jgi:hypothetical protein
VPPTTGASGAGAYRRYARVYDLVWSAAPSHRFVDLCLAAAECRPGGHRVALAVGDLRAALGDGGAPVKDLVARPARRTVG